MMAGINVNTYNTYLSQVVTYRNESVSKVIFPADFADSADFFKDFNIKICDICDICGK